MSKEIISRVSLPGRIFDLLWKDDEFYREVCSSKRANLQDKFPRCDQWCDEEGFYMAFALAGYSPSDLSIEVCGNEICVSGYGSKFDVDSGGSEGVEQKGDDDEYPTLTPNLIVQKGMIVRGIARRNFKLKFYINPLFNAAMATASMKNGLLEVFMPKNNDLIVSKIDILEN